MIQILLASESYESTVFSKKERCGLSSNLLSSTAIRSIFRICLASSEEIKEFALDYLGPPSIELMFEIYIQNERFECRKLALGREAFHQLKIERQQKCIEEVESSLYQLGTAEKEAETDRKKTDMLHKVFEELSLTIKKASYEIFPNWKESPISYDAMCIFTFANLPMPIRQGHFEKIGINMVVETRRQMVMYSVYDRVFPKIHDEFFADFWILDKIKYATFVLEKKLLQESEKDLKKLKKKLLKREELGFGAYQDIAINNQERPYNEAEYLGLKRMEVDHLKKLRPTDFNSKGQKNIALLREEQKRIAKKSSSALFTKGYIKMKENIVEKIHGLQRRIDELQEYFLPLIDPCCSGLKVPLGMSIEVSRGLNKFIPFLSEERIGSLSKPDCEMYFLLEKFKKFAFETAYSFFDHFPRIGGFNRRNLILSFSIGIEDLSLGRSIRVLLSVEADGTERGCPIGGVYFLCCCLTAVKIGKELLTLVSTWENLGNRQQKVHKDSQIIYKVMGMNFDSRALEHPDLFKPDYSIKPIAKINIKKDQIKNFVGKLEEGDDSLKESLEKRFDKYENLLKQQCERHREGN